MELSQVLRIMKRFLYDEVRADYGSVRPIEAIFDEETGQWKVTCEYKYTPHLSAQTQTKILELTVDNVSGNIQSFRQVK